MDAQVPVAGEDHRQHPPHRGGLAAMWLRITPTLVRSKRISESVASLGWGVGAARLAMDAQVPVAGEDHRQHPRHRGALAAMWLRITTTPVSSKRVGARAASLGCRVTAARLALDAQVTVAGEEDHRQHPPHRGALAAMCLRMTTTPVSSKRVGERAASLGCRVTAATRALDAQVTVAGEDHRQHQHPPHRGGLAAMWLRITPTLVRSKRISESAVSLGCRVGAARLALDAQVTVAGDHHHHRQHLPHRGDLAAMSLRMTSTLVRSKRISESAASLGCKVIAARLALDAQVTVAGEDHHHRQHPPHRVGLAAMWLRMTSTRASS